MAHEDANGLGDVDLISLADQRDRAADNRDGAADRRDSSAVARDLSANARDGSAARRDEIADLRDEAAQRSEEQGGSGMSADAVIIAEQVRANGRNDRRRALEDREASAARRSDAGEDRDAATGDRSASATDRHFAEGDRDTAELDSLTGVFMRFAGGVQLDREIARAKRTDEPLVVVFIDVDQLKAVNDKRGHAAGDDLLRRVATTLRSHLRVEDLIFRYGGDEFVCACVGLTSADTAKRVEDVQRALSRLPDSPSISAGLAELRSVESATELIRRADAALYRGRGARSK